MIILLPNKVFIIDIVSSIVFVLALYERGSYSTEVIYIFIKMLSDISICQKMSSPAQLIVNTNKNKQYAFNDKLGAKKIPIKAGN